ncbi:MAG: hypothetical protein HYV18_04460 [Gammaproteobacteria bacterium]|nr:hypothetical protein [Gammaproteobacteria bacterium]
MHRVLVLTAGLIAAPFARAATEGDIRQAFSKAMQPVPFAVHYGSCGRAPAAIEYQEDSLAGLGFAALGAAAGALVESEASSARCDGNVDAGQIPEIRVYNDGSRQVE